MSFTPGNWSVEETDDFTRQRVVAVTSDFLDTDRRILATFGPASNQWAQSNARLFAAAPTMLDTLKAMLLVSNSDLHPRLRELAEAAIAKAEGK